MTLFCAGAGLGTGTTMSHEGFGVPGAPRTECVVFLFESWVLDTPGKYVAATLGTVALSFADVGVRRARESLVPRLVGPRYRRVSVEFFAYALERALDFILMLVVMTFSVPLFFAVVVGLSVGHFATLEWSRLQR